MSAKQAAGDVQDELEAVHRTLTQQQRSNLAKMEKQGWEAADWKACALESTQKLAAANAQASNISCNLNGHSRLFFFFLFFFFFFFLCPLECVPLLLSLLRAALCQGSLPTTACVLRPCEQTVILPW